MKYTKLLSVLLIAGLVSPLVSKAQNKTVTLDYFFNNEHKKDASGNLVRYHYTWEDHTLNGYSMWGDVFKKDGATLKSLEVAPTAANLKGSDIYIIVDPDTKKESPDPNYIEKSHIKAIADWVKNGGVLVMMANDSANTELDHFNQLAGKFGIQFTKNSRNMVKGKDFETGRIVIPAGNPVFTPKSVYLKEISVLSVKSPAKALVKAQGDVIMATAQYGKGTVFAVGDPWIYNEYVDGKRIPAEFENPKAMEDLSQWLLKQVPGTK